MLCVLLQQVLERKGDARGGYIIVMTDGQGTLDQRVVNEVLAKVE